MATSRLALCPQVGLPSEDDLGCHDTYCNTFSIDFCYIHGLKSYFQSVEHHLFSTKPHLLFLTETQLSVATDSNPFSVPSYFFYPHFQLNADSSTQNVL